MAPTGLSPQYFQIVYTLAKPIKRTGGLNKQFSFFQVSVRPTDRKQDLPFVSS